MSLADAIERNRARHKAKQEEKPDYSFHPWTLPDRQNTERRDEGLRAYTIHVITNPPCYMIELGLEPPPHEETRTIYGTSKADAKKRAGID